MASNAQWIEITQTTDLLPRQDKYIISAFYNGSILIIGGNKNRRQMAEYKISESTMYDHGDALFTNALYCSTLCYSQYGDILRVYRSMFGEIDVYNLKSTDFPNDLVSISIPNEVKHGSGNCVLSNDIYLLLIGGWIDTGSSDIVQVMILDDNTWFNGTSMPQIRRDHGCIMTSEFVYVIGGFQENSVIKIAIDDIETGPWISIGTLSDTINRAGYVLHHDLIYIIGGTGYPNDTPQDSVHTINVIDDTITFRPETLPYTIYGATAIIAFDILYSFNGVINADSDTTNKWMKYTLPTLFPTVIPTSIPTFAPSLIPTVSPTKVPSWVTLFPTIAPITLNPTFNPTSNPSFNPTSNPSSYPSFNLTLMTSLNPTMFPTLHPNTALNPTSIPTLNPTLNPTFNPTLNPTFNPTLKNDNKHIFAVIDGDTYAPTINEDTNEDAKNTDYDKENTNVLNETKDDHESILPIISLIVIVVCCIHLVLFITLRKRVCCNKNEYKDFDDNLQENPVSRVPSKEDEKLDNENEKNTATMGTMITNKASLDIVSTIAHKTGESMHHKSEGKKESIDDMYEDMYVEKEDVDMRQKKTDNGEQTIGSTRNESMLMETLESTHHNGENNYLKS